MIPSDGLSNTQSLTGEAKIESLNSIYNRVARLKSKHASRRLMIKQPDRDNYQSHNSINTHHINIQQSQYDNNTNSNNTMQTAQFPYTLRRQSLVKLSVDRQSDSVETNFWPSQNLIRKSRMMKFVGENKKEDVVDDGKRRVVSMKGEGGRKGVDVIMGRQSSNNNRRYLLSEYAKQQTDHNDPTIPQYQQHHKQKQLLNFIKPTPNSKPSSSTSLSRQFTSNKISRQLRSASYRISSQYSKSKLSLGKRTTTVQRTINNNKTITADDNNNTSNNNNNKSARRTITTQSRVSLIKGQSRYKLYKQQICKFQHLYQCLSHVLASIKSGAVQVQRSISLYSNYIQSNSLSFIDDFIQHREIKLQKLVKTTRLQQSLSICYLFLEISQERVYDNQSYLVNFIGHSLANLLLVMRVYVINEGREGFQLSEFQVAVKELEKATFSQQLTSQADVLLRIQHNTQILTMIPKKLGRNNQKFQSCIVKFLKVAQRQKYSCTLSAHYIFEFLAMHIHQLNLVGVSPTLELAPKPYAAPSKKLYTLVIQPLGILEKGGVYRPYVNQFMRWAGKNFDVILWTWEQTLQVENLFNELSQFSTTKLYRHHCKVQGNIFTKDLSRLGRDLDKTLIIDFDKRIFSGFQSNGIECRWRGNKSDKSLLVLSQILQQMIASQTCVQDTIIFYAQELFSVRGY